MVLSFLHIHIQVYSGYIRTECEVCRTFGCAQHEFKFTAQGVDARGSASLTTESASEKTKGNLVTKKKKTRHPDMSSKPLPMAYHGLKHMSLQDLLASRDLTRISKHVQDRPSV